MASNYPGALDSFTNPTATDSLDSATVPHADQHANVNNAVRAVQVTLGTNPQGGSATVVARLDALDSTVAGKAATNQTMYVGTTALAINRSSASQTLTGVSIDGNAGTVTNGVYTSTTSLPNVTSVNGTSIPASGTLLTSATTSLPNVTSVNGTTIPATATLLTSASTSSALTSFGSNPALSGTPTAPTAAVDTNTTQIASTAFVLGQAASATPAMDGTAAVGTSTRYARADHVHGSDTTKANLSGASFTGAVAVTSGNLSQTGSGQVLVQSTSTSAVPVVVKPAGSLTITGLSASHSGGSGQTYDTISGFSSTVGLAAGQTVVLSGFSDANFNGSTTIVSITTSTIRVTSLNSTNGTGTGGQIVVTGATQQNLQEWQYNSGTAVASVGASGIITASSFSGSGASLTSLNGANLSDGSVTAAKLSSTAAAPSLWYSPTASYTTGALSINTAVDPFGLTNGVTVGNSKTYYVEYVLLGNVTHSASTSTGIRVTIAGDAVANVGLETLQASIATSPNGNWPTANNYSAYINGTTANWQIGGSIVTGTAIYFKITLRGILRTAASGSYFQPKLALTTVSATGTSTITTARESYASLIELGTSTTTQLGTWS